MLNYDCRSILNHPQADFYQLNTVVKNVRENLDFPEELFGALQFELHQKLVLPLQNLDDLSSLLFKETESNLNEDQNRFLIQCKRTLVSFYCYLKYFVESLPDNDQRLSNVDANEGTRKLTYEFFRYASYELRTPFYSLMLYSQAQKHGPETMDWEEFANRIFSSPFVPDNQEIIEKINYWVDVLSEFMNALPRFMQDLSDGD